MVYLVSFLIVRQSDPRFVVFSRSLVSVDRKRLPDGYGKSCVARHRQISEIGSHNTKIFNSNCYQDLILRFSATPIHKIRIDGMRIQYLAR